MKNLIFILVYLFTKGKIEADQSRLDPGTPNSSDGKYFFGQIKGGKHVQKTTKYNLKGPGIGVGIMFKLSK